MDLARRVRDREGIGHRCKRTNAARTAERIGSNRTIVKKQSILQKIKTWLRQTTCLHYFKLSDLSLTGIVAPEPPAKNARYDEWEKWFQNQDKVDAFTKRVQWPCAKCGKMFFAHCGLDILSHGTLEQLRP